jgi:hypothetical protein
MVTYPATDYAGKMYKKNWTISYDLSDTTSASSAYHIWNSTSNSTNSITSSTDNCNVVVAAVQTELAKGQTYDLPDGGKLVIDDNGNYKVEEDDAKVVYQANRVREWSPYLNASDMLGKFMEQVATMGVSRKEVLQLPLELFVAWLVIEAAERDGDEVPEDVVPVKQHRALGEVVRPKCLACGKFVKKLHARHRFPFCDLGHAERYMKLMKPEPAEAPAFAR